MDMDNGGIISQARWNEHKVSNYCMAPRYDPVRRFIEKYTASYVAGKQAVSAIEIGAYAGRYLSVFGCFGCTLNGIDLNPLIEDPNMRNWLEGAGFKVGILEQRNFYDNPSERFDIVSSFGFVEHFENYDEAILRHVDYLKEGGMLIIVVPNFAGYIQKKLHKCTDAESLSRHVLPSMNPFEWKTLLEGEFDIRFCGYMGGFDYWSSYQKRNAWQKFVNLSVAYFAKALQKSGLRDFLPNQRAYSPYAAIVAVKK